MDYDINKEPKYNEEIINVDDYMLEAYVPDHYLLMYAQLEPGMEGKVAFFLDDNEVILDFYGTRVIADLDDFQDGTFILKRKVTKTEAKLALASTKPTLVLIK